MVAGRQPAGQDAHCRRPRPGRRLPRSTVAQVDGCPGRRLPRSTVALCRPPRPSPVAVAVFSGAARRNDRRDRRAHHKFTGDRLIGAKNIAQRLATSRGARPGGDCRPHREGEGERDACPTPPGGRIFENRPVPPVCPQLTHLSEKNHTSITEHHMTKIRSATELIKRIFDGSTPEPNTGCWLWDGQYKK